MNTPRPVTQNQLRRYLQAAHSITLFTDHYCPGCGAALVNDASYDGRRHEVVIPVDAGKIALRCQRCEGQPCN